MLIQVTGRLVLEQRLSYQTLRRDLGLDEAEIADLCTELLFRGIAQHEDGKGLVLDGNRSVASRVQSPESEEHGRKGATVTGQKGATERKAQFSELRIQSSELTAAERRQLTV